ncbi:MAG: HD domain-containing protein [Burkholderiaceae bacterium]
MAALIHDVGKANVTPIHGAGDLGHVDYPGHAEAGAGMVPKLALRLRVGTREREYLVTLVRHHGRPKAMVEVGADAREVFGFLGQRARLDLM